MDALQKQGDVIGASRLIETRLQSPDDALALLASVWPTGKQAIICLEEQIALLSRLHRSTDLRALIVRVGKEAVPARLAADLINLLARTAEHAVSTEVHRLAAEAVRIRASTALSEPAIERSDEHAILRALTRIVPHDRLLSRDVHRYRERRPSALPLRLPPPSPNLIRRLTLEKTKALNLPKIGNWTRAEGNVQGFGAVSRRDGQRIFFTRGTWDAAQQSADWTDPAPAMESAFFLKICADKFILGRPFSTGLKMTAMPATGVFNHVACSVGTPEWLPDDSVQVSYAPGSLWVVRVVSSRIVLMSFNQSGTQIYSQDVTEVLIAAGSESGGLALSLEGLGAPGCIALGYGNCLLITNGESEGNNFGSLKTGNIQTRKFEHRVIDVLPGRLSAPGWIVILERGAAFVSLVNTEIVILDEAIVTPRAAYLGDGRLVLLGSEEGKIFQRHDGKWLPSGWFTAPPEAASAIALIGTNQAHEFALFQSSGAIQRWNVPN